MTMRDKRENKETRLNFSSNLDPDSSTIFQAGVPQADYDRLLLRWKDTGRITGVRNSTLSAGPWRAQFVSRLRTDNYELRELILSQAGARKHDIRQRLMEVGGNPLAFLNLLGVSPGVILHQLESWQNKTIRTNNIAEALPSHAWSDVRLDYLLLKKAARKIAAYEKIFEAHFENISLPIRTIKNLKDVEQFLRDLKRTDIGGFKVAKKGAPAKEEFRRLIVILVEICRAPLTKQFGNKATAITLAAITAILNCGFPEMLKGRNSTLRFRGKKALRTMKDAYRLWSQDHAGELLSVPLANHGENVIEICTWPIVGPKTDRRIGKN